MSRTAGVRKGTFGIRGTTFRFGAVFLMITAVVLALLAVKPTLQTMLRSGSTIDVEFATNYHGKLYPNETEVKYAGIVVGVVSDIEQTDRDTVVTSLKVDDEVVSMLGSRPTARVTPKTVLGGQYAIELGPGGAGEFTGDTIPVERTSTPVELDRLLESLPGQTRESLQDVVANSHATLAKGGGDALRDLADSAPDTLDPAADVLTSALGTQPRQDLPRLVTNLKATAESLRGRDGQLGEVIESLDTTTASLSDASGPLADAVADLPDTLRSTRSGMVDLRGTLDRLKATAADLRPAARELTPLLNTLNPVLRDTKPLLTDLNPLLQDAEPAIEDLVPVAERGTKVLEDIRGPVIKRVRGPILDKVMNTWRGSGPYENSGGGMQADHKLYEELAYMIVNLDRASKTQDAQGSLLGFQAGLGSRSLAGVPFTLPNLVEQIQKYAGGA
ncbi:MlaD family protein [Haloechinothrix salitolerans]|uniref:MlaD family protein n=1 Tax=Haloechinothrix salitolerans TaxID=926830 RepID=A0ABW2C3H1_9PSEU